MTWCPQTRKGGCFLQETIHRPKLHFWCQTTHGSQWAASHPRFPEPRATEVGSAWMPGNLISKGRLLGFPGGSDGKESACNAGNLGSIPGLGRSPGEGHGNPVQYGFTHYPQTHWEGFLFLTKGQAVLHDAYSPLPQLSTNGHRRKTPSFNFQHCTELSWNLLII